MAAVCGICRCAGSDLSVVGCGCTLHVRCLPLAIVAEFEPLHGFVATKSQLNLCPCCQNSFIDQLKLLPLGLDDLDRAVELQKKAGDPSLDAQDQHFQEIEAEASYVHLSRGGGSVSASLNQNNHQRTGRWTNEEIAYTDYLVDAFDQGKLPVAQGVRLNDFLGDMLMCKGSRLTKKMKNAKLSSRSYELSPAIGDEKFVGVDTQLLSKLEDDFLKSIACEARRLELRFHTTKAWRTHFSNFCLQLSSSLLEADEWVTSLEIMEQRAAQAEEAIRKARRLRMGIALKTDVRSAQQGVFFNGMAAPIRGKSVSITKHMNATHAALTHQPDKIQSSLPQSSTNSITSSDDGDADFISNILDYQPSKQATSAADDFASLFDELACHPWSESSSKETKASSTCAVTFVEELVSFIEQENLPFEHVDLWVPSFAEGDGPGNEMRLYHAGQGTRGDLDASLYYRMCEYGEYSTKFSFAVGHGLPGRVYCTDKPSWERHIHEQDPKIFERAGGAKMYGVKTGFGVPVVSKSIGRIVVVFYSVHDIQPDLQMMERIVASLSKYSPTPKWKLVVEMGDSKPVPSQSSNRLLHYEHNTAKKGIQVPHSVSVASIVDQHEKLAPASICMEETHEEEQHIASLLGQYMPMSQLAPSTESGDVYMLPFFMSLRLLLLRAPNRRSPQEAEKVETIIKSYRGYLQGDRKEKQIVDLLVQDWRYLSQSEDAPRSHCAGSSYESHVMDTASMNSITASGVPSRQPHALSFVPPPNQAQDASACGQDFKKRRVSSLEESGF
ncbi:hypothetical protein FisN_16Lh171 [Fistulifera solaris]|uniref:Uncharacterized protein n=1 Tax=Fistulifera solaris TaxID=1519565 RepID=A0A1Z5KJS1_FISSO|nr:hypothetical protein FisN_16Lh171 [Fistulifera solaris]|eukprot:GAX26332.1 hypothetical protein FisN_16Lh171 [Fistulifera solaris]